MIKGEGMQVFMGTTAICVAGILVGKLWFMSSAPLHRLPPQPWRCTWGGAGHATRLQRIAPRTATLSSRPAPAVRAWTR